MATIWKLSAVSDLRSHFEDAGPVNEEVVQAHLATLRPGRQQAAPFAPELPRWFYLYSKDRRVILRTVSMSLERWQGAAKVLIGTFIHIGEFEKTKEYTQHRTKGLRITMEPMEMLEGAPQRFFSSGEEMLQAIDWSALDELPAPRPDQPGQQWQRERRPHRWQ